MRMHSRSAGVAESWSEAYQTSSRRQRGLRVIARPAFNRGNPYNCLLYRHMMAAGGVQVEEYSWRRLVRGRHDIWHLHWPEGHLNDRNSVLALRRSATALALMRWARSRGTKIVWTIHNLRSHEQYYPVLERLFREGFLRLLDGHISLSHSGAEAALAQFPRLRGIPGFVIPHGHYREYYTTQLPKAAARLTLGIDPRSRVLAFIGQIRPYKDVPQLIASFRVLTDPGLVLLVAGEPNTRALAAQLHGAAGDDPRVHLSLGWIPEDRILAYVAAADLVVLPYREVLNSGSALLALSCDRPVLVPAIGSLAELETVAGSSWVRTYSGPLTSGQIKNALDWAVDTGRPSRAPLQSLDWDEIAAATLRAYRTVVAATRR
jgi:beta-1,4-mannosyltransferase